ncbi:MAG: hypothetical protein L7T26_13175, partial [Pseudomonadales bacterium]|nr:hypothetical protein [Pseudomonadales bacterium]
FLAQIWRPQINHEHVVSPTRPPSKKATTTPGKGGAYLGFIRRLRPANKDSGRHPMTEDQRPADH